MNPKIPAWLIPLIAIYAAWNRLRRSHWFAPTLSAYAASFARVGSWIIVLGLVNRGPHGSDAFALLMLIRGTIGLISYAAFGWTPGLIHLFSRPIAAIRSGPLTQLEYEAGETFEEQNSPSRIYATAQGMARIAAAIGVLVLLIYLKWMGVFHQLPANLISEAWNVGFWIGMAVLVRMISDVTGALLQARGKIAADNACLIAGEIAFVVMVLMTGTQSLLVPAAVGCFVGSVVVWIARLQLVESAWVADSGKFDSQLVGPILAGGAFAMIGQISDWFYAPVNQILINRYLPAQAWRDYAPALQVDGAILLLVGGLASVMLPKAAMALSMGRASVIRKYYLSATIFSVTVLALAAAAVCLVGDFLLRKWLGNVVPGTRAILPLVLIHTVIGGSASIARSVLFGMGRMKPYAIGALIGGVSNAVLALIVVTTTNWGLRGIIGVTIFTVFIRCGLWLPWYTLRAIRQEAARPSLAAGA